MNDKDAIISELEKRLKQITTERDKWATIAKTLARYSCTKPYTYYGRTVDYAIQHAEQNS
jgi:hypothetical protein